MKLSGWLLLTASVATLDACTFPRLRPSGNESLRAFKSEQELSDYLNALSGTRDQPDPWFIGCPTSRIVSRQSTTDVGGSGSAVVRGTVRDEMGAPLDGVTIVAGRPFGTQSAGGGNFRIEIPPRAADGLPLLLRGLRIGYRAVEDTLWLRPGVTVTLDITMCVHRFGGGDYVVSGSRSPHSFEVVPDTNPPGADHGGLAKLHGEHLVILRRQRLYAVSIDGPASGSVSSIDAFGPGIDPRQTVFEEILLSGDRIVVLGYNQNGVTEIGVIGLDSAGRLHRVSTTHVRSAGYRLNNHTARLVGNRLAFYTELAFDENLRDPIKALPSMRRWREKDPEPFTRIAAASNVYRPPARSGPIRPLFHTLIHCDIGEAEPTCRADVVLGPAGGIGPIYYRATDAVYLWMSKLEEGSQTSGNNLVRFPDNGLAPSAIGVPGAPIREESFSLTRGHLNVMVARSTRSDSAWFSADLDGLGALQIPIASLGDGSRDIRQSWLLELPPDVRNAPFHRFVGDHLLYRADTALGQVGAPLQVVDLQTRSRRAVPTEYPINRVEVSGSDVFGLAARGQELHVSAIDVASATVRAHALVRLPWSIGPRNLPFLSAPLGPSAKVLSIAVAGPGRPNYDAVDTPPSVHFFRAENGRIEPIGALSPREERPSETVCGNPCADWFGNARPIFFRGRIFALFGNELVEAEIRGGRLEESRRVTFAPRDL